MVTKHHDHDDDSKPAPKHEDKHEAKPAEPPKPRPGDIQSINEPPPPSKPAG